MEEGLLLMLGALAVALRARAASRGSGGRAEEAGAGAAKPDQGARRGLGKEEAGPLVGGGVVVMVDNLAHGRCMGATR
jgi:hypothetical protein